MKRLCTPVLLVLSLLSSAWADPPLQAGQVSCAKAFAPFAGKTAKSALRLPVDPTVATRDKYHSLIEQRLEEIPRRRFTARVEKTLDLYSKLYPAFPRASFEKWLAEGRMTPEQYRRMSGEGMTLGEVLQKEYLAFIRPDRIVHERKQLQWGMNRALEEIRESMAKYDPGNPKAFEQVVAQVPGKITRAFQGSCVAKNPVSLASMARDFGIMLTSYSLVHAGKESPTVENFPWEYVASSVMFTVVLGEVGCRNFLQSSHLIGTEVPVAPQVSRGERMKKYFTERIDGARAYLKWSFILNPVGLGVIAAGENLREQAGAPEDYAMRLGYYLTYDSALGTLRRTFVQDPLFLYLFPQMETALKPLVKSSAVAFAVRNSAELATRVGLRWGDTELFLGGDRKVKEWMAKMRESGTSGIRIDDRAIETLGELADDLPPEVPDSLR